MGKANESTIKHGVALLVRPGSDHHLGRVQGRQNPGLVEDAFPPDFLLSLHRLVGSV